MRLFVELLLTLTELARVLLVLPRVERARRRQGPRVALEALRRRARSAPCRGARGRGCLRRAIRWVDGRMADGGNCYRRALLEVALDRGAAADPLLFGFTLRDEQLSGHAWLGSSASAQPYHFTVRL